MPYLVGPPLSRDRSLKLPIEAPSLIASEAVAKLSPADPSWKLPAVDGGKRQPDAFNETFQKSTNDLWSDEVARGRRLVNYFNEWDIGRLPPQSDYTMNALFRWGWSQQEPTTGKGFHDPQFAWVLEALQADGVDVGTEQLQNEVWKHDQLYQNPDLDGTVRAHRFYTRH